MVEHFYEEIEGWFDFRHVYEVALSRIPDAGSMVEVGVCYGRSFFFMAVEAMRQERLLTMYAVDPFRWPADVEEKFRSNLERIRHPYLDVVVCKGLSVPIANEYFDDASQDFVFIDAEHTYEEVLADCRAWWPKVKPGGVLAGHDWGPDFRGVEKAVMQFTIETTGSFSLIPCDGQPTPAKRYVWWIEKP